MRFAEQDSPKRAELGFADAVVREFAFLVPLGFHVDDRDNLLVSFRAGRRFVVVSHEPHDFGLDVTIGRPNDDPVNPNSDYRISLSEIVEFSGALEVERLPASPVARSRDAVGSLVARLAELTRRYAADILAGDDARFTEIKEWVWARDRLASERMFGEDFRRRANQAWEAKRYSDVVLAYRQFEAEIKGQSLRPSERARLEYARRRCFLRG